MIIFLVFLALLVLLIIPFLPGIAEIIRKKDANALFIPEHYARNPRYFGISFKQIIKHAAAGFTADTEIHDALLSKKEKLEILNSTKVPTGEKIDYLLYIKGDLTSDDNVRFLKEVYITGDALIGANNIVQVIAADGNVKVASGTQFLRWLDAEGTIEVGKNCNLGICASSGDKLYLAQNCLFRRLFGMPITTGNIKAAAALPKAEFLPLMSAFVRKKDREIPAGTVIDKHIVFTEDVNIGHDAILMGDVKSYGNVVIEENATIHGNVFADGDIYINSGAKIGGNVFSQKAVYIAMQAVISRPDVIKSVVGKKKVRIEQNVTIYGYVTTEGDGITA